MLARPKFRHLLSQSFLRPRGEPHPLLTTTQLRLRPQMQAALKPCLQQVVQASDKEGVLPMCEHSYLPLTYRKDTLR